MRTGNFGWTHTRQIPQPPRPPSENPVPIKFQPPTTAPKSQRNVSWASPRTQQRSINEDHRENAAPNPRAQSREPRPLAVRAADAANSEPPLRVLNEETFTSWPHRLNHLLAWYNDNAEDDRPTPLLGRGDIGHKRHGTNIGCADRVNGTGRIEESSVHERDFVVERIIPHGVNTDRDHPTANVGETMYRIRWEGYNTTDDTYEPARHLPRNKQVSYYKQKGLFLTSELPKACAG